MMLNCIIIVENNTITKHMENKQTAVEWLDRWFRDNPEATHEEGNKALEQAKQIEKEQIIEAFKHGELPPLFVNYNAEQYYQETYNKS